MAIHSFRRPGALNDAPVYFRIFTVSRVERKMGGGGYDVVVVPVRVQTKRFGWEVGRESSLPFKGTPCTRARRIP